MPVSLTYSLADQSFERTKSLGILGLSVKLAESLAASEKVGPITLFSNSSLSAQLKLPPRVERIDFDRAASGRVGRLLWDQTGCYAAAERAGREWLFLPKGFASFLRKPPGKLAAYVHDVMHDYYRTRFPNGFSRFESWYFDRALAATLRDASVIFTNTAFTRSEVLRVAGERGITPPRVLVAGIGFREEVVARSAKEERIVVLAGPLPHKRSDLAVEWVDRWQKEEGYPGEIHVIGGLPQGMAAPGAWRQHRRLGGWEFAALLSSARGLVYFSEYEGFGMPPVEAVLAGTCPVFSDLPATREVMGECGCPFRNDDFGSFREAMRTALAAEEEVIRGWSVKLRALHAWSQVAERVISGLEHG